MRHLLLAFTVLILATTSGCKDGDGFTLLTLDQDIELGQQLKAEIASDPANYPILSEAQYPDAYAHLYRMRDAVLNSGQVKYRNEFAWEVYIIGDDNTLNAFCAPGGYIYVYTGLIKYLESEDQLTGVMGHEIAHADRRHSSKQITKAYGLSFIVDLLLGENQGALTDIAQGLVGLAFSRADEKEADEYSVKYLCPTTYNAAGAAGFFAKIEAEGGSSTPAFLSTHPSPDRRVENINNEKVELGCDGSGTFDARYQDFINSLP